VIGILLPYAFCLAVVLNEMTEHAVCEVQTMRLTVYGKESLLRRLR
jgi:hypothetical protein